MAGADYIQHDSTPEAATHSHRCRSPHVTRPAHVQPLLAQRHCPHAHAVDTASHAVACPHHTVQHLVLARTTPVGSLDSAVTRSVPAQPTQHTTPQRIQSDTQQQRCIHSAERRAHCTPRDSTLQRRTSTPHSPPSRKTRQQRHVQRHAHSLQALADAAAHDAVSHTTRCPGRWPTATSRR